MAKQGGQTPGTCTLRTSGQDGQRSDCIRGLYKGRSVAK